MPVLDEAQINNLDAYHNTPLLDLFRSALPKVNLEVQEARTVLFAYEPRRDILWRHATGFEVYAYRQEDMPSMETTGMDEEQAWVERYHRKDTFYQSLENASHKHGVHYSRFVPIATIAWDAELWKKYFCSSMTRRDSDQDAEARKQFCYKSHSSGQTVSSIHFIPIVDHKLDVEQHQKALDATLAASPHKETVTLCLDGLSLKLAYERPREKATPEPTTSLTMKVPLGWLPEYASISWNGTQQQMAAKASEVLDAFQKKHS